MKAITAEMLLDILKKEFPGEEEFVIGSDPERRYISVLRREWGVTCFETPAGLGGGMAYKALGGSEE